MNPPIISSVAIPCQKFNSAEELKTLSRSVLSVDAQRMLGVLDGAMKKVLMIMALEKMDSYSLEKEELDEEIRKVIKEYLSLSRQYSSQRTPATESLTADDKPRQPTEENKQPPETSAESDESRKSNSKNAEGSSRFSDSEVEVQELKEKLLLVVRQLLRMIKNSPQLENLTQSYLTIQPRSSSNLPDLKLPLSISNFPEACSQAYLSDTLTRPQSHLMRYFLKLRGNIFSNMLTTPEDVKRKKKYLKEICNRLNKQQAKVDCLTKELEIIVVKNKAQVQATANKIAVLQQEIQNLENYLFDRGQRIKKEEMSKMHGIEAKYQTERTELESKLAELKKSYNQQVELNKNMEKKKRNNLFKIEMELESKISAYDQEMSALKVEYDTLDEEYTREKEELNELEERFQTLEEEYLQIMEERRLEEGRKQREEEQRRALEQAVCTIQAYWRSYITRKMARGKRGTRGRK
ncbi:putative Repeat organellar protein [Fasciola hepatica]|uniref:Dynein regulatory complex protein 10 n=1 Tax=Fasciola hepatica TaxID=6192 RepID=A0A4E0RE90_FASHE|nr:putative Repeat organellar protein [Fasciola hepatica]